MKLRTVIKKNQGENKQSLAESRCELSLVAKLWAHNRRLSCIFYKEIRYP